MKRRHFMKSIAAGVAGMAIGLPLARRNLPRLGHPNINTLFLQKVFYNEPIPLDADHLEVALYRGNPFYINDAECSYGGYTRAKIPRTPKYWGVGQPEPASKDSKEAVCWNEKEVYFGNCTMGTEVVRAFGILHQRQIVYWGFLNADLYVSTGMQPCFAPGDLKIDLT